MHDEPIQKWRDIVDRIGRSSSRPRVHFGASKHGLAAIFLLYWQQESSCHSLDYLWRFSIVECLQDRGLPLIQRMFDLDSQDPSDAVSCVLNHEMNLWPGCVSHSEVPSARISSNFSNSLAKSGGEIHRCIRSSDSASSFQSQYVETLQ